MLLEASLLGIDVKIRSLLLNELLHRGRVALLVELEAQAQYESLGHDRLLEIISRSAIAMSIFAVQTSTGRDRVQGQLELCVSVISSCEASE